MIIRFGRFACLMFMALFSLVLQCACNGTLAQGVRAFGVPNGKLPPKSFGNPLADEALRLRFPMAAANIASDDLSVAGQQIRRTDANGDGITTRQEWADSGYSTPRHFFYHDLNGDGLLTFYEHSIGVANWRLRNERRARDRTSAELAAMRKRDAKSLTQPKTLFDEPATNDPQTLVRREQIERLSAYLIRFYDIDQNGSIDKSELRQVRSPYGSLASADRDRDGVLQGEELTRWLNGRLPGPSKLAPEFQSIDLNEDGQVSLEEYASGSDVMSFDEFRSRDRNGDGLITPRESRVLQESLSQYENVESLVIKPSASIVSDIQVRDELEIAELVVMVDLRKTEDRFIRVELISPGFQRVVLFKGEGWQPWRGGPILDGVSFDDEAPKISETLRQPPWRKLLQPHDRGKLSSLSGQSAQGRWRLVVRNQDQRVALLVGWRLLVKSEEGIIE